MPTPVMNNVSGSTRLQTAEQRGIAPMELVAAGVVAVQGAVAASLTLAYLVDMETIAQRMMGSLLLLAAMICLHAASGLARSELGSQKRAFAGSVFILGFSLPLMSAEASASVLAALSILALGAIAFSRSSEPLPDRQRDNV
jgi:hypothetical protein